MSHQSRFKNSCEGPKFQFWWILDNKKCMNRIWVLPPFERAERPKIQCEWKLCLQNGPKFDFYPISKNEICKFANFGEAKNCNLSKNCSSKLSKIDFWNCLIKMLWFRAFYPLSLLLPFYAILWRDRCEVKNRPKYASNTWHWWMAENETAAAARTLEHSWSNHRIIILFSDNWRKFAKKNWNCNSIQKGIHNAVTFFSSIQIELMVQSPKSKFIFWAMKID